MEVNIFDYENNLNLAQKKIVSDYFFATIKQRFKFVFFSDFLLKSCSPAVFGTPGPATHKNQSEHLLFGHFLTKKLNTAKLFFFVGGQRKKLKMTKGSECNPRPGTNPDRGWVPCKRSVP